MADEAMVGTTVRDCSREVAAAPLVPIVRQDSLAAYVMTHYEGVCHQGTTFIPNGRYWLDFMLAELAMGCVARRACAAICGLRFTQSEAIAILVLILSEAGGAC